MDWSGPCWDHLSHVHTDPLTSTELIAGIGGWPIFENVYLPFGYQYYSNEGTNMDMLRFAGTVAGEETGQGHRDSS